MDKHTPIADIPALPEIVRSSCAERGVTTLGEFATMPGLYDLPGMDEDAMLEVWNVLKTAKLISLHWAADEVYTAQRAKAERRAAAIAKARRTLEYYERHADRVRKKIEEIERG